MAEIKWWEEQPKLWEKLVPKRGQSPTLQGELIRCTGKLTDEAYRNGNMNWESGYERLVRFVVDNLDDPTTFTDQERRKIRILAQEIIDNFESPDLSGKGSAYYYLTEMAVRWCLAHPDPMLRDADPTITI
jgi:hypothetical protein